MNDLTNTNNKEQVAANPATQTLFRFTSLRNPQLAETIKENLGFIRRPEIAEMKGFFDEILETWSASDGITKFAALTRAAQSFSIVDDFSTEKKLTTKYKNLINLGKTISRREIITEDILNKSVKDWDGNSTKRREIWDHFIYQVVTQKDFYIKETIVYIIKAIHYIEASTLTKNEGNIKINGEDFRAKAATAVIVFPEALVLDMTPQANKIPFTVNKSKIGEDRIKYAEQRDLSVMEQHQLSNIINTEVKASKNILKKESFETLKNEIEILQKDYNESYNIEYKQQYDNYQASIKPEVDRYEHDINAIEATFTDQTTDAEKEAAYLSVTPLNIPAFNFDYPKEIDLIQLQNDLTSDSFALLLEVFTNYDNELKTFINDNPTAEINIQVKSEISAEINDFSLNLNKSFRTFGSVISKLENNISESFTKVLSAKEVSTKRFANMGGILLPITDEVKAPVNSYYLQPVTNSRMLFANNESYLQLGFAVEDNSWSVSSMKITATTNTGSHQEMLYDIPVVDGKISPSPVLVNKFNTINTLKVEIWFDNQCETILEATNVTANKALNGAISIMRPSQGNETAAMASTAPSVFQPKYFGVKRLGIADYLKVEQSIHAYVPGEVSNIENVMASELRHKSSTSREYSEITNTTSKSQETEKMSDTTKATRTDMQTEVARELDRQQSTEAHTTFSAGGKKWRFEVGGSYASNTAQHDSTRQAVAKSQEITERAMERVLSKISEERVEKIIKEYTETNVHEFDNRGKVTATTGGTNIPPQHITGVYRWVDKKMKNQIYNYGKRSMFEFMIPEPSRLHNLAVKAVKPDLVEPVDPRKTTMPNANVDESILKYWADYYNVEYSTPLPLKITKLDNLHCTKDESNDETIIVPENYICKSLEISYEYKEQKKKGNLQFDTFDGRTIILYNHKDVLNFGNLNFINEFHLRFYQNWLYYTNFAITQYCDLSNDYITKRKNDFFKKIIEAYDVAYVKYKEDQAAANTAAKDQEKENKEKASILYRNTEANVLKHNCIAYLLQSYNSLGQEMSIDDGKRMESFYMKFGDSLDQYTALAKFMEQAFEWNVMDYTFYPYYWANKNHWQDLYLSEEVDPLFRSFLQAGMARVIVTVKPGFEDAVQFFMNTGRIWNGGEVPVIGDPLYLSIVDELRQPTGEPQGKYWITRVPTTLTILQAKSVGLEVTDALPIFPDDPENCENPRELETKSAFEPVDAIMQHGGVTESTLS